MKDQNDPEQPDLYEESSAASMAPIEDGEAVIDDSTEIGVDDQGTDQFEAVED